MADAFWIRALRNHVVKSKFVIALALARALDFRYMSTAFRELAIRNRRFGNATLSLVFEEISLCYLSAANTVTMSQSRGHTANTGLDQDVRNVLSSLKRQYHIRKVECFATN